MILIDAEIQLSARLFVSDACRLSDGQISLGDGDKAWADPYRRCRVEGEMHATSSATKEGLLASNFRRPSI